jgi:hypothetical protein
MVWWRPGEGSSAAWSGGDRRRGGASGGLVEDDGGKRRGVGPVEAGGGEWARRWSGGCRRRRGGVVEADGGERCRGGLVEAGGGNGTMVIQWRAAKGSGAAVVGDPEMSRGGAVRDGRRR